MSPAVYVALSVAGAGGWLAIGYGGRKIYEWANRGRRR